MLRCVDTLDCCARLISGDIQTRFAYKCARIQLATDLNVTYGQQQWQLRKHAELEILADAVSWKLNSRLHKGSFSKKIPCPTQKG